MRWRFSRGTRRTPSELAHLPGRDGLGRRGGKPQGAEEPQRRGVAAAGPLMPGSARRPWSRCSAATVARPRTVSRSPGSCSSAARVAAGPDGAEIDEPDRLLGAAAAGAGDARHGDRDVGAEPRTHAGGHRRGGLAPRRRRGARSSVGRHAELALLDRVRRRRRRRRRTTSLAPGTEVRRAATSPPVHDSAVASVRPCARALLEHELLDRALGAREEVRGDRRDEGRARARRRRARRPASTSRSTWISKSRAQIVASTPSRSPPAAASACGDRRLADAVEAQHAPRPRNRRARADAERLELERRAARAPAARAEAPEGRRRGARPCSSSSAGAVPARPTTSAPCGIVACLRTPGAKSA